MSRSPATPPLLKDMNERTVLEAIRADAPISRAEISRRIGISKPTVSLALRALVESGLVRESATEPVGPRYGATFFEPVADAALALGFDLGGRFLRGAICDLSGEIRARQDVDMVGTDVIDVLEMVARLRDSLVAATGLSADRIDRVVVGIPGVVEGRTERIDLATSVPGLEGESFGSELRARLELPVTLENDVNLAALGEQWLGVARGVEDFVFLSIGTGMGAGLVVRGELHRGHHGAAGEVDFALVGLADDVDPCAGAISSYAERLVASAGVVSSLEPPFDPRAIFSAARSGDATAQAVVDEVARRIALHVVPIASVTDVSLVVLGGGLGANGDLLLEPVRALLRGWIPYPPRLEASSLGEAAVLSGALAIGLRTALDNVFLVRRRPARAPRITD